MDHPQIRKHGFTDSSAIDSGRFSDGRPSPGGKAEKLDSRCLLHETRFAWLSLLTRDSSEAFHAHTEVAVTISTLLAWLLPETLF